MDYDVYISKVDEGHLKLSCDDHISKQIKNEYKFFAPGYKFHPLYRNPRKRVWDGKVSLFNLKTRKFPAGLLKDLTDFLDDKGWTYTYDFPVDGLFDSRIDETFLQRFYGEIFRDTKFYPREYQHIGVRELLFNKKAVIEYATASGKSLIIYCLIRYLLAIKKRIVLVVPNIMLVEQMRSDFRDYGWKDCDDYLTIMYMGHEPDIGRPVLVSTYQSLVKRDESFIMRFNAVIVDEAHGAPANSIQTILDRLVYADHRLGMTGTLPDHTNPEELGKVYEIFGCIGPLVASKKAKELMDEGFLSNIKIANLVIKYPEAMCIKNRSRSFDEEMATIIETPERNGVFKYILNHIPADENTIILVYQIAHLDSIFDYCQKHFGDKFKIRKISGSVNAEERMIIKDIAENESGVVVVATFGTMSIGVNIKRIHNVVLGSSFKSKVRILQTIGRGLRLHETKDWLTVFDIVDDMRWKKRTGRIGENHVWKHFEERLKHYQMQEYPFTNKIIRLEDL